MIRKLASEILEKYPDKFTADYETNKKLLAELADIPSKKLKNRIAGYISQMKRVEQRSVALTAATTI
jgi:small subunit ribosomal protein S17e